MSTVVNRMPEVDSVIVFTIPGSPKSEDPCKKLVTDPPEEDH
jgi:hypothetical protein